MNRLARFFRSFRTLALIGALTAPMLPWPGLAASAVANEIQVGGDSSLSGGTWGPKPAFHALVDVNGDGFADLIYTVTAIQVNVPQTNVYVQYSDGANFGAPVVVATDSSTRVQINCGSVCHYDAQALINAVGDVNGDGHPDILFADGTIALGNGSGFGPKTAWGGDTSLSGGTWTARPAFHALVDVNGDGFADLIYTLPATTVNVPQTNVYVQYSNGSSFGAPVIVATDSSTSVLVGCTSSCHYDAQALINAVGDVNGDGHPDILFADGTVALGNGSGFGPKTAWGGDTSLSGTTSAPWRATPAFHALVDVNGDGFADLIYTLPATTVNVPQTNVYVQYSNASGTSFGAPIAVATDSSTSVLINCGNLCHYDAQALINAVGDVNGDGQKDLLFANGSVSSLSIPFTMHPKFFIGSVIYLPPGAGVGSKISYGTLTMNGTTVSTTESWSVDSSAGAQFGTSSDNLDITFGNSFGGSTTTSVDEQQTFNKTLPFSAPPSDSINHDYDQIQVFFGVNVNTSVDYLGNVTWGVDFSKMLSSGFAPEGYTVPVGCLQSNSSIYITDACNSMRTQFGDAPFFLTSDDYPALLNADPYSDTANQPPKINADRYTLVDAFQFQPDPGAQPVIWSVTNAITQFTSHTSTYSYSVSVTANGSLPLAKLKGSTKFTWTNSWTNKQTTSDSNSSTLTLAHPSDTYTGPATLNVYVDTIYKTFMFSFQ